MPVGRSWFLVAVLAAALAGCGDEPVDADTLHEEEATGFEDRHCPPDSELTYDNFGAAFLQQHCESCHKPGSAVSFTSKKAVRAWADQIWERAADENVLMPPGGGPTVDERVQLGEWLACGAP